MFIGYGIAYIRVPDRILHTAERFPPADLMEVWCRKLRIMTETRARRIQAECRRKVEELTPNPAPRKWPPKPIEDPRRLPGAWLYVYKRSANTHPEAILVRDDGTAHILLGAMRGAFDCMPLGLPKSSELFLGSTDHGRYQMFDNGVVVWEAAADVGFPVRLSRDRRDLEGRKTSGLVAFFDIRGFTAWSERHKGSEVQGVVGLLEREIQAAFGRAWVKKLFLKGTGDGTMIVAENGWRGSVSSFNNTPKEQICSGF